MSISITVYTGNFDPITLKHLNLIERANKLFQTIHIAIKIHPTHHPLFTIDERITLLEKITHHLTNVRIEHFDKLLIQYCHTINTRVIVHNLRATTDFEYELQIAHTNADMEPTIDTIFLPTRANYDFMSTSLVREIANHNDDMSHYAPPIVRETLHKKFPHP